MFERGWPLLLVSALFMSGAAEEASAQTNTEVFEDLQWNFSPPGARANGMGRAFIALADDATAAVANPAGLAALTRPQVYFEYKNTRLRLDRLAAANAIVSTALPTQTFGDPINALSFVSLAWPLSRGIVVSFGRHQFLDYRETFDYPIRQSHAVGTSGIPQEFYPVHARSDFSGASYIGSLSGSLLHDKLRLGLSISGDRLKADSDLTRYDFLPTNQPDFSTVVNRARIPSSTATSMSVSAGVIVHPTDTFSAGAVYTKSPSFKFSEDFLNRSGSQFSGTTASGSQIQFPVDLSLHVPSRFGAGVAVRPAALNTRLQLLFDVSRVKYSDLINDFVVTASYSSVRAENFTVDDKTEIHFGGEYEAIRGRYPVLLRAGIFTNPDHSLRFVPTDGSPVSVTNSTCNRECMVQAFTDQFNLLPQTTRRFGTVGAGVVVGPHTQIDVSYVTTNEFVASIAARF
jgi:long-chain fatty acid transport protein